jgi:hypothetical protein
MFKNQQIILIFSMEEHRLPCFEVSLAGSSCYRLSSGNVDKKEQEKSPKALISNLLNKALQSRLHNRRERLQRQEAVHDMRSRRSWCKSLRRIRRCAQGLYKSTGIKIKEFHIH